MKINYNLEVQKIRLLEYEAKQIFSEFDIPLANRLVIEKGDNIKEKINQFNFPAIVKSQIAIGSRKKQGLIKIVQTNEEAISLCEDYFSRKVGSYEVEAILVEGLADIKHEYYCSIALDTSGRQFVLIASAEGGIDIEEVAATNPDAIIKQKISLIEGLSEDNAKSVAKRLGFQDELIDSAMDLFIKLWRITKEKEAQLVEINPLVLTPEGLVAVDGKMMLDDNAFFRQETIQELQKRKLSDLEKKAKQFGFSFVELDGKVGILANGAGLTMALLDVLAQHGLAGMNFLDVGGGADKDRVYEALKLIFTMKPKAVLINIYGGITRCDVVADAILHTLKEFPEAPPMVIRLTGTKEAEGVAILKDAGIDAFQDMMDAVEKLKGVVG
ncbi:MAG: ADP-forming succinate--CoA ligase subunit beta [Candidatus Hodarchaeales archaeon]